MLLRTKMTELLSNLGESKLVKSEKHSFDACQNCCKNKSLDYFTMSMVFMAPENLKNTYD